METVSGLISWAWYVLLPLLLLMLLDLAQLPIRRKKKLPPGPYPWPLIGNMMSMTSDAPHVELMKLARTHGPLMLVKLGAQPVVIASTPASAMEVLKSNDRVLSGRSVPHSFRMKNYIEHSVLWADCNDTWKALRRISRTELFSTKMLDAHTCSRERKVAEMLDFVRSKHGEEVVITEFVFGTILNILGHVVFSKDVFHYGEKGDEVGMQRRIREMVTVAASPNISDFYPILACLDLQGRLRDCVARTKDVVALWEGTVKERKANRDPSKHDFLQVLLANGFDDAQIDGVFLEIFGPTETTSATIEWAMAELLRNPEKMGRVKEELEREVGPRGSSAVSEIHMPRLPYLQACVKETMRLHPAAPLLIPHRAVEECTVMGYTIPKDCQVMVNAYAMGRDPEAWKTEVNAFVPERFLTTDLDYYGNNIQFIPFGSGRRMCMGYPLVLRTIPLILGSLIHTFDWSLPHGMPPSQLDMKEKLSLTLVRNPALVAIPRFPESTAPT